MKIYRHTLSMVLSKVPQDFAMEGDVSNPRMTELTIMTDKMKLENACDATILFKKLFIFVVRNVDNNLVIECCHHNI